MRVLVTGATGFIGSRLIEALHADGIKVDALSRNGASAKQRRPLLSKSFDWDPMAQSAPVEAIESADAIFHLAGESVGGRWNEEKKKRIRESRVVGTMRLVEGIAKAAKKPSVLITASGVGYYGDRGSEVLTEDSGPGDDFLAEVGQAWEGEALRAREFGVRVSPLRIAMVLDAGGPIDQMAAPFRFGFGGPLGSGEQWMSWIHREDVVGLMLQALRDPRFDGAVNAVSPNPVTNREFTATLAKVVHRPALVRAPQFALRLVLGEFADVMLGSQRAVPKKALEAGYEFRFPRLEEALRASLGK